MNVIKDFFSLNFLDYENIGFYFPIGVFLTLLCISMCALVFFTTYYKKCAGALCRGLLRHEALSEESAKTLAELRLDGVFLIRYALGRGSGQLTYAVKQAGVEKLTYEEYVKERAKKGAKADKIDFKSARFYVLPERRETASKIVTNSETSWLVAIAFSVLFIVILVLLANFLPSLLEAIHDSL